MSEGHDDQVLMMREQNHQLPSLHHSVFMIWHVPFFPTAKRAIGFIEMLCDYLPVGLTQEGCLFGRRRCYIDMLVRKLSFDSSKALLVVVLVVVVECIRSMHVLVVVVVAVERELCSKLHWWPRCIARKRAKKKKTNC